MKIENTEVYGIKPAIRGMRNPLNSWDKSDSFGDEPYGFYLGENDKILSQKLTKAGAEHSKFLRQIQVWVDLSLPRYIWSEFDTYRFNTKNSCSTMHTLMRKELTNEDFEYRIPQDYIDTLNKEINIKGNIGYIKNLLPEGFIQKRTVNTNYAELLNMYNQRKFHKLPQWHEICEWILKLPYFVDLTNIV
jgi:hypothetical protein